MSTRFLIFTRFRVCLFVVLCIPIIFGAVMGPRLYHFFSKDTNAFVYKQGNLAVHFVDVGHGDCTIIQLPDGRVMIIDGGSSFYSSRIENYIRTRIQPRNNFIDFVVNTHPHADHLDGLLHVKQVFDYGVFYNYQNFTEGYYILGINYRIMFHAVAQIGPDPNDVSPIITLEYYDKVFVFTGDAGIATENLFIQTPSARTIFCETRIQGLTVYLQVGHHGSRTSTGNSFLEFIQPSKAIISLGFLYNHPHDEVINNLNYHGIKTLLTREAGHIVISTSGNNAKLFMGFDNMLDLTPIWVVLLLILTALVFTNYNILWSKKVLTQDVVCARFKNIEEEATNGKKST